MGDHSPTIPISFECHYLSLRLNLLSSKLFFLEYSHYCQWRSRYWLYWQSSASLIQHNWHALCRLMPSRNSKILMTVNIYWIPSLSKSVTSKHGTKTFWRSTTSRGTRLVSSKIHFFHGCLRLRLLVALETLFTLNSHQTSSIKHKNKPNKVWPWLPQLDRCRQRLKMKSSERVRNPHKFKCLISKLTKLSKGSQSLSR